MFQGLNDNCLKILIDIDSSNAYTGDTKQQILERMVIDDAQEVFVFHI